MVGHDHADLQDQLPGMLGLLRIVREGMEAGKGLGDDGSREWRRGAEIRQKKALKAWWWKGKKDLERKGEWLQDTEMQDRRNGNKRDKSRGGRPGWRLNSLNKHPIN